MAEIFAPVILDLAPSNVAIATTGTARTISVPLPRGASFSVELLFSSPGDVDVLVDAEEGNERPATEQVADANLVVPESTVGASVGRIGSITDENVHIINFSPVVAGVFRLLLTGQGSNNANTVLTRARLVYVKSQ